MPEAVHVHSQTAIEEFRAALLVFRSQCQDTADELNAEIRRFADWIEHDRPAYWKQQIRLAERGVHDAKLALERCLLSGVGDERPACREERAALHHAQMRLTSCRAHAERVRHWRQQLHHEQSELTGRLSQLGHLIDWNVPQAAATLKRILDRLDAYLATQTAGIQPTPLAKDAAHGPDDLTPRADPELPGDPESSAGGDASGPESESNDSIREREQMP